MIYLIESNNSYKIGYTTDERGVYYLNPQYFFKGKLADRAKCFKQIIEYNIED